MIRSPLSWLLSLAITSPRTSDEVAVQAAQGSQGVGVIPRRPRRRSRGGGGLCGGTSAQGGPSHDLILPGAALSAPPSTPHTAARVRIASRPHPLRGRVAAITVAVCLGMLLTSVPHAFALSKNTFSTSFSGSGQTALSNPSAIAVDQSTGDVYVTDPADHRVEKFTASGEFVLMFGRAVNKTGADLCLAGEECQSAAEGSTPGAFTDPRYLAVDNSPGGEGDLYVGDYVKGGGSGDVQKFDSSGNLLTAWRDGGILESSPTAALEGYVNGEGITGIAVDEHGELVVAGGESGAGHELFFKFAQAGSFIGRSEDLEQRSEPLGFAIDRFRDLYILNGQDRVTKLFPGGETAGFVTPPSSDFSGLGLDSATGDLYASQENGTVEHFAPSCESTRTAACPPIDTFGAGHLAKPMGVAVDASTETVYVADSGDHSVAIFSAVPYLPTETASAAPLSPTAASLAGDVDPASAGPVTACRFQYTRIANEVQTLTLSAATGTGDLTRTSKQITGLATSTGTFAPGEPIEGPGIPPGTTVAAVGSATLVLSKASTASGIAVALGAEPSGGTFTLTFEGHTTEPLSSQATSGQVAQQLIFHAGINQNVAVSGPPGGPYEVEFNHELSRTNVPQLTAGSSALAPPGATVKVATATQGNGEWSSANSLACRPDPASEPPTSNFTVPTPVSAEPEALTPGTTYHYRLAAEDASGFSANFGQTFTTLPLAPELSAESLGRVLSDTAVIDGSVNPGGGEAAYHTSYHVEYVTQEQFERNGFSEPQRTPDADAGSARTPQSVSVQLTGLTPATAYRYRIVAANASSPPGGTIGPEHTFTTLPSVKEPSETCPNAHVRQQTSAAQLLDCRAYELVSATNTGGYDVESDLIEGQTPFPGYPQAEGRVLYGVHDGGIPGTDHPTNRGVDPYIATRGHEGWSTEYVGIPADDPGASGSPPFGSPLLQADARLKTFAFGGPGLCAPCFSEGIRNRHPPPPPRRRTARPGHGPAPSNPNPAPPPMATSPKPSPLTASTSIFGSTSSSPKAATTNRQRLDL